MPKSELFSRIATELYETEQIQEKVRAQKREQPEQQAVYVAPGTPIEKKLAEIWGELLNVERVGLHDNFFGIGGHSLLATQLISRVRQVFQVELPLRVLLTDSATLEEMAGAVERCQIDQADADEIFEVLAELDGLSEEELRALIADEGLEETA